MIYSHFSPDAIESAVAESVPCRWLVNKAMDYTGKSWDVEPRFDPHKNVLEAYLCMKASQIREGCYE